MFKGILLLFITVQVLFRLDLSEFTLPGGQNSGNGEVETTTNNPAGVTSVCGYSETTDSTPRTVYEDKTSQNFSIPDSIYKLCPFSDICNKTASEKIEKKGLEPCCASCRCDVECGLRLDCCYDYLDKYQLIEKQFVACIEPVVGFISDLFITFPYKYYMVKMCSIMDTFDSSDTVTLEKRNINSLNSNTIRGCELIDSNKKSLLSPVSSSKTDNIYVNAECARCNNVTEFDHWDYEFVSSTDSLGLFTSESVWKLHNTSGAIVFVPSTSDDWRRKRCFDILDPVQICDCAEMKENCKKINLLYQTKNNKFLKNIYCEVCSSKRPVEELPHTCTAVQYSVHRTHLFNYMTVLINREVVQESATRPKTAVVCLPSPQGRCLPVHCPQGMLMTPSGCKYFIKRWYTQFIGTQFKLTHRDEARPIQRHELEALSEEELQNPLKWIYIPCRGLRFSMIIYTENSFRNISVDTFYISIGELFEDGFDPRYTFNAFRKCLNEKWIMTVNNVSHRFEAEIGKYQDIRLYPFIALKVLTLNQFVSKKDYAGGGVPIKKTFFCNQVHFEPDEVENMGYELTILALNITFGNNEYSVNSDMGSQHEIYSVCATDLLSKITVSKECIQRLDNQVLAMSLLAVIHTLHELFYPECTL